MTDLLADIRRAEATARAQRMSPDQKARFLRDRGWRRMSKSKTQRWQAGMEPKRP